MSEMVERVAQLMALFAEERAFSIKPEHNRNFPPYWQEMARAAIEAMREPTDAEIPTGKLRAVYAVTSPPKLLGFDVIVNGAVVATLPPNEVLEVPLIPPTATLQLG